MPTKRRHLTHSGLTLAYEERRRLGMPGPPAEIDADRIDRHQIARLVQHGCPPRLASRIVS